MKCIICLAEKPPSPEHVIPRALGGSFVIHRVCHDCNSMLGANKVDQGLIEHNASVERRVKLQIAGHRGSVPDPLANALRRPIETNVPNVRIRLNRVGESYAATVQPRVKVDVRTRTDDELKLDIDLVVAEGDEHNAPMYLKSALRKKGITDEATLERICADTLPKLERRQGPLTVGIPMRRNEGGHHLGLTKIAYEMAHYWLGEAWLDDPIAAEMRRALRGDKSAGGRFTVGDGSAMDRPRFTTDLASPFDELPLGYDPTRTNLMTLYPVGTKFSVCVWLLDAFTAMYLVTEDGSAFVKPVYDSVAMDVVLRQYEEFETVMPVLPPPQS